MEKELCVLIHSTQNQMFSTAESYDTVSVSLPLPFSSAAKLSKTNLQRSHCILNYNQHMLNVICHLAQQLQFKHTQDFSPC